MLADLDDIENPGGFSPPPFTQLKLKRRTPILAFICVMIVLAGAGGYAAWTMRPDFREAMWAQYVKVRILIGKPLPQPPAPVRPTPVPVPVAPSPDPTSTEGAETPTAPAVSDDVSPESSATPPGVEPAMPVANQPQSHPRPRPANPQR
jgi:hypothetical protein